MAELFDEAGAVEGLDGEHTAAFVTEHQEPADADAVGLHELRPPSTQERAVAVPADLDVPDRRAKRADEEGLRPGTAVSRIKGLRELVGDALHNQFRMPQGGQNLGWTGQCRRLLTSFSEKPGTRNFSCVVMLRAPCLPMSPGGRWGGEGGTARGLCACLSCHLSGYFCGLVC